MELQESLQRNVHQQFLSDVLDGLSESQKRLPSKYFYDQRGSELFDQICELDEYYPTRTEIEIMRRHSRAMAQCLRDSSMLIEFGSGSSVKTDYLLSHLDNLQTYVPVDISADHLAAVGGSLQDRYPHLTIRPLAEDFTQLSDLPQEFQQPGHHSVYFPGSTIGNFETDDAEQLLSNIAEIIKAGGVLLLGIDLVKDVSVMEAAYNDARGVTAEFNRNVLRRINDELDGEFDLDAFQHVASWNNAENRIEMHLRSLCEQTVRISDNNFSFRPDDTICTEYSHKYTMQHIEQLARLAGLQITMAWTDDREWFAVLCLKGVNQAGTSK